MSGLAIHNCYHKHLGQTMLSFHHTSGTYQWHKGKCFEVHRVSEIRFFSHFYSSKELNLSFDSEFVTKRQWYMIPFLLFYIRGMSIFYPHNSVFSALCNWTQCSLLIFPSRALWIVGPYLHLSVLQLYLVWLLEHVYTGMKGPWCRPPQTSTEPLRKASWWHRCSSAHWGVFIMGAEAAQAHLCQVCSQCSPLKTVKLL